MFVSFLDALPGAASQGLIWGIMAIGLYITYKLLELSDLTVDGSFCTGGAVCAALIWPAAFTLPSALRAASDVKFPLVISMFSMWTFRVALSYVFALDTVTVLGFSFAGFGLGPLGVWVAMTVDWVFRTIFFVIRYLSGKWLTVYKTLK